MPLVFRLALPRRWRGRRPDAVEISVHGIQRPLGNDNGPFGAEIRAEWLEKREVAAHGLQGGRVRNSTEGGDGLLEALEDLKRPFGGLPGLGKFL